MQLIPAELENNSLLVGLILFYAIIDMLAWSRNGILRKVAGKTDRDGLAYW